MTEDFTLVCLILQRIKKKKRKKEKILQCIKKRKVLHAYLNDVTKVNNVIDEL